LEATVLSWLEHNVYLILIDVWHKQKIVVLLLLSRLVLNNDPAERLARRQAEGTGTIMINDSWLLAVCATSRTGTWSYGLYVKEYRIQYVETCSLTR